MRRSGLFSNPSHKCPTDSMSTVLEFKSSIDLDQTAEAAKMIRRPLRFVKSLFVPASGNRYPHLCIFEGGFMAGAKFGTGSPESAPSGSAITWLNAYRMRKTVACSVKMITKSGWSAQTTAWQAWCRVAVPARSGKIRIDANLLKNQPLAIDACIILKPSAVTATASKPKERSNVLSIPKTISFKSYLKNAFNTRC